MRPLLVVVTVCLLSCFVGWMASDDFLIAFYVAVLCFALVCTGVLFVIFCINKVIDLLFNLIGGA